MYKFRLATVDDFKAIRDIMLEVYDALDDKTWYCIDDSNNEEYLKAQIDHSGLCIVAEDTDSDNEVIGFLLITFPRSTDDNLGKGYYANTDDLLKVAHMENSAVKPNHRGSHLMCQLIEDAEKRLGKDYIHLMATVHPDNHASLSTLIKCGYKIIRKQNDMYGSGFHRLIMLKEVSDD
jgi:ribosomal protein S18 acetylase RimI-like enzyme